MDFYEKIHEDFLDYIRLTECNHIYIDNIEGNTCVKCGYIKIDGTEVENNTNQDHKEQVIFDDLIDDVESEELKQDIKEKYHKLTMNKNLRNNTKKSILSVCYYFVTLKSGTIIYPSKFIQNKFSIKKKSFTKSLDLFLELYIDYRIIKTNISDYIEAIWQMCKLPIKHFDDTKIEVKKLDDLIVFQNVNPFILCAAMIYNYLIFKNGINNNINQYSKNIGIGNNTMKKNLVNLKSHGLYYIKKK